MIQARAGWLGITLLLFAGCGESGEVTPTSDDPALNQIDAFIAEQEIDREINWRILLNKPPQLTFDPDAEYRWHMTTNVGKMTFRLFPGHAPMHASSTIYLTRLGFYDGLKFHRAIQGFMAQGGCPFGNGRGDPGYKYDGEIDNNVVTHDKRGLLSMANSGRGTDGSQFFITFKATPWLDEKHTIFGEIIEGEPTLTGIESQANPSDGPPLSYLAIEKCEIEVVKRVSK